MTNLGGQYSIQKKPLSRAWDIRAESLIDSSVHDASFLIKAHYLAHLLADYHSTKQKNPQKVGLALSWWASIGSNPAE